MFRIRLAMLIVPLLLWFVQCMSGPFTYTGAELRRIVIEQVIPSEASFWLPLILVDQMEQVYPAIDAAQQGAGLALRVDPGRTYASPAAGACIRGILENSIIWPALISEKQNAEFFGGTSTNAVSSSTSGETTKIAGNELIEASLMAGAIMVSGCTPPAMLPVGL